MLQFNSSTAKRRCRRRVLRDLPFERNDVPYDVFQLAEYYYLANPRLAVSCLAKVFGIHIHIIYVAPYLCVCDEFVCTKIPFEIELVGDIPYHLVSIYYKSSLVANIYIFDFVCAMMATWMAKYTRRANLNCLNTKMEVLSLCILNVIQDDLKKTHKMR